MKLNNFRFEIRSEWVRVEWKRERGDEVKIMATAVGD